MATDPLSALIKLTETTNKINDLGKIAQSATTGSAQDAAIKAITLTCQFAVGEAAAAPGEATGFLAIVGMAAGMAAANAAEQACHLTSEAVVNYFNTQFSSYKNTINSIESQYSGNSILSSDLSALNNEVVSGNYFGTSSAIRKFFNDCDFAGITLNSDGSISYQSSISGQSILESWNSNFQAISNTITNSDGSYSNTTFSSNRV